jgi:hypothetical protein
VVLAQDFSRWASPVHQGNHITRLNAWTRADGRLLAIAPIFFTHFNPSPVALPVVLSRRETKMYERAPNILLETKSPHALAARAIARNDLAQCLVPLPKLAQSASVGLQQIKMRNDHALKISAFPIRAKAEFSGEPPRAGEFEGSV